MSDIIHDLELSVRATNVLTAYGRVKTLEDFLALDRKTVMAQPRSGTRTWEEIKRMQLYLLREGERNAPKTKKPDDGGPMHPIVTDSHIVAYGASLRDAAALAALQGILGRVYLPDVGMPVGSGSLVHYATLAFAVADAFIAAREGKTE